MIATDAPADPTTKALALARVGAHVLPIRNDGSKGTFKGIGVNQATADPEQIVAYWTDHPGALVGVACGPSGLAVLDLDRHPGRPDGFTSLAAAGVETPATWTHTSLSGKGEHRVYAAEGAKGWEPFGGVEVKGAKQYVVWTGDAPTSRDAFAPAPAWMLRPATAEQVEAVPGKVDEWITAHPFAPDALVSDTLAALPPHGSPEWSNPNLPALARPIIEAARWSHGGADARELFAAAYASGEWADAKHVAAALRAFDRALAAADYPACWADVADFDAVLAGLEPELLEAPATPPPFQVLTRADLKALPRPEWLVQGLLQEAGVVILAGEAGIGKTFVALDWACSIATGTPWHGRTTKPGRVLYVAGEGVEFFDDRVSAWEEHRGALVPDDKLVYVREGFSLSDGASVDYMRRTVAEGEISLVVLDTLSQLSEVESENDNAQLSAVLRQARAIRQAHPGATVLILHHVNKGDRGRVRGASAIRANADAVIVAKAKAGDAFALTTRMEDDGKQKNAPAEFVAGFYLADAGRAAVVEREQALDLDRVAIEQVLAIPGPHPIGDFLAARGEDGPATSKRLRRKLDKMVSDGLVAVEGERQATRWSSVLVT